MSLSDDDVAQLHTIFHQLDDDGSGHLDKGELGAAMAAFGHPLSADDLDALMEAVDADGSGAVDVEEFIAGLGPFLMQLAAAADDTPGPDPRPASGNGETKTSKLSQSEIAHLETIFHAVDTDSSNSIDREEFGALLRQLPDAPTDEDVVSQIFTQTAPDGSMTLAMFIDTMAPLLLEQAGAGHRAGADAAGGSSVALTDEQYAQLTELFASMDDDGSGEVDIHELQAGMRDAFGASLDMEEVAALMAHIDQDGNGSISCQEFISGIGPLFLDQLDSAKSSASARAERIRLVASNKASADAAVVSAVEAAFADAAESLAELDATDPEVVKVARAAAAAAKGADEPAVLDASGLVPVSHLNDVLRAVGASVDRATIRSLAKDNLNVADGYMSLLDVWYVVVHHTNVLGPAAAAGSSPAAGSGSAAAGGSAAPDEVIQSFSDAAMERIMSLESALEAAEAAKTKADADYARLRATAESRAAQLDDAQAELADLSSLREDLARETARADAAVAQQNALSDEVAALKAAAHASGSASDQTSKELAELRDWKRATLRSMALLQDELATAQQTAVDATDALDSERKATAELAADRDLVAKLRSRLDAATSELDSLRAAAKDASAAAATRDARIKDLEDELAALADGGSRTGGSAAGSAMADELASMGESYTDVMGAKLQAAAEQNTKLEQDIAAAYTARDDAVAAQAAAEETQAAALAKLAANESAVAAEREQMARKEESFGKIVESLEAQIAALKSSGAGAGSTGDGSIAAMSADELRELNHKLMDQLGEFEQTQADLAVVRKELADVKGPMADELADARSTVDDLQIELESVQAERNSLRTQLQAAQSTAQAGPHPADPTDGGDGAGQDAEQARAAAAELLAANARVAELETACSKAQAQATDWEAAYNKALAKIDKAKAKRTAAVEEATRAIDELASVSDALAAMTAERDAALASSGSSSEALEAARNEATAAAAARDEAQASAKAADAARISADAERVKAQAAVKAAENERDAALAARDAAESAAAAAAQDAVSRAGADAEQALAQAQARVDAAAAERDAAVQARDEAQAAALAAASDLAAAQARADGLAEAADAARAAHDTQTARLEDELRSARAQLEQAGASDADVAAAKAETAKFQAINRRLDDELSAIKDTLAANEKELFRVKDESERAVAAAEKSATAAAAAKADAEARTAKLETDIVKLKTQAADMQASLTRANDELDRVLAEKAEAASSAKNTATSVAQLEAILLEKDHKIRELEKANKRADKDAAKSLAAVQEKLASAEAAAADAAKGAAKAKAKVDKLKAGLTDSANALVETEDALRAAQAEASELRTSNAQLAAQAERAAEAARADVAKDLADAAAETARLADELQEAQHDMDRLQAELERAAEKRAADQETAAAAAAAAAAEKKTLMLKLAQTEQHAQDAESRCATVMSEVGSLEAKMDRTEAALKTAQAEAADAAASAHDQMTALKKQLVELESKLETQTSATREANETLDAALAKLEKEKGKRSALKDESRQAIADLQAELASTTSQLRELQDTSVDAQVAAKAALDAQHIAEADAQDKQLKIDSLLEILEGKDAELEAANKAAHTQANQDAKALEKAREELVDSEHMIEELSAKLTKRNDKVSALKTKAGELADRVVELESQVDQAKAAAAAAASSSKNELAAAADREASLTAARDEALASIARLDAELARVSSELEAAVAAKVTEKEKRRAAKAAAQEALAEANDARDALTTKLNEATAAAAETSAQLEIQAAKTAGLEASLGETRASLATATKRNDQLESRRRDLTLRLEELEKEAAAGATAAAELSAATSELETLRTHVTALQDKIVSEKAKRKDAAGTAANTIAELEEQLEEAQAYRDKLGSEKTRRRAAEADHAALLERSRAKVEELSATIDELKATLSSERVASAEAVQQNSLLQSSVATLESQVSAARVEAAAAQGRASDAEAAAKAAQAEAAAAAAQVEAAQEEAETARAEASAAVRDATREQEKLAASLERTRAALAESQASDRVRALTAQAEADAVALSELTSLKDALLDKVAAAKEKRGALKVRLAEALAENETREADFVALQAKAEKLVAKYTQEKEKRVALLGELEAKQAELEEVHAGVATALGKEKGKRQKMMMRFARQLEESQAEIAELRTAVMAAENPTVSDERIAEFNDTLLNLETKNASLKEQVKSLKASLSETKTALKDASEDAPALKRLVAQKDAEIGALRSELEVALASVKSEDIVKNVTVLSKRELPPAQRKAFIKAKEIELSEEEAALERLQTKLKSAGDDFVRMRAATREAEELLEHAFVIFDSMLEVVVEPDKEAQLVELRGSLERREAEIGVAVAALKENAQDEQALHGLSVALATLQDTLQIAQADGKEYAVNQQLREAVSKVPLFDGVTDVGFVNDLVRRLRERVYEPGQFIIREGEQGDSMYFVTRGRVGVLVGGERVTGMEEGAFFGEIAVLIKGKRTASIKAETYVEVYELDKESLLATLDHFPEQKRSLVKVGEDRLINDMKKKRKKALAVKLPEHPLDDYARRLKIVGGLIEDAIAGRRRKDVEEFGQELVALAGTALSEVAEENDWVRAPVGAARGHLRGLLDKVFGDGPPNMTRPDLDDLVGPVRQLVSTGRAMVFVMEMGECLERVPFLANTDEGFKKALLREAHVEDMEDNAHIINAGERGDRLYFLVDGTVTVILPNGQRIGNLAEGASFGENGFVTDVERTANVWAITPVTVVWMDRSGLERVFDGHADGAALREQIIQTHHDEVAKIEYERLSLRKKFKESLRVIAVDNLGPLVEELVRLDDMVVADLDGVEMGVLEQIPPILARVGDMVRLRVEEARA